MILWASVLLFHIKSDPKPITIFSSPASRADATAVAVCSLDLCGHRNCAPKGGISTTCSFPNTICEVSTPLLFPRQQRGQLARELADQSLKPSATEGELVFPYGFVHLSQQCIQWNCWFLTGVYAAACSLIVGYTISLN